MPENTTPPTPLTFAAVTSANGKHHEGFTSLFSTDAEAAASIDADPEASEFAKGLAEKEQGFRERGWTLSEAQRFWLHRVITPKAAAPTVKVDASAIEALLATAASRLKVAKAGPRSRYHGSITVAAPTYGEGWFGVIKDGQFRPARDCTDAVTALVKDFAADPAKVAGEHGHRTGNCCFCRKELTTTESLAAGYGPTCAEHYGLPWGKVAAA